MNLQNKTLTIKSKLEQKYKITEYDYINIFYGTGSLFLSILALSFIQS